MLSPIQLYLFTILFLQKLSFFKQSLYIYGGIANRQDKISKVLLDQITNKLRIAFRCEGDIRFIIDVSKN
jgi:hypothetical protein